MKLRVKRFNIRTDTPLVVVLEKKDAITYDLHTTDRVEVSFNGKKAIAVVDILDYANRRQDKHALCGDGCIGLFEETIEALGVKEGDLVKVAPAAKPKAIQFIKKKMDGHALAEEEMLVIVQDIVDGALTDIELTSFVTAAAIRDLTFEEVTYLTRSIANTGDKFVAKKTPVIDKHCIGGVPGNRTTMVVIPILAALGLTVPKTSSRAITSPSGTADTMECLANVSLNLEDMHSVVNKTGACMVWGGAMRLAPADDKIIRVERPLSIDVTGLMLSSVMAKKYSVGATHVIIDVPYGMGAKVATREEALTIKKHFLTIGKLLGMQVVVILTDGRQPIGKGIGCLLEARDVMAVLECANDAPQDLREKSLMVASTILEFANIAKKGEGLSLASKTLDSKAALKKMQEIIQAQGAVEQTPLSPYTYDVKAECAGIISAINNKRITRICRVAGAPVSKAAGIYLHKKVGSRVKKGDVLCTVYAGNGNKSSLVQAVIKEQAPYTITPTK